MVGIGVIGYGYWGPNLVRNFMQLDGARVVAVSDLRQDRLKKVEKLYPGVRITQNHEELLKAKDIDAIILATPVFTHYRLGLQALENGKHLLLEKPMTSTAEEGRKLAEVAAKRGLTLLVDHTFVYTDSVRKIKDLVQQGEIGDIYYYDSVRINLGLFQPDVNVVWDLAPHDLAIMDYVMRKPVMAVSAVGMAHVAGKPENIAYLTCYFQENIIAHFHLNWLSPVKVRQTLVAGSKRMILYNDLEPSEKIRIYDRGLKADETRSDKADNDQEREKAYQAMVGYRFGDIWLPNLANNEALTREAQHFLDCINGKAKPETGAAEGIRVVEVLEAASRSMRERGRVEELSKQ